MKRLLISLLVAVTVAGGLYARGSQEAAAAAPGDYQDGNYRATFSHVDSRGWQPFLDVEVVNGRIRAARFDYVNSEGTLKTRDQGYNDRMASVAGIAPKEAFPELGVRLVSSQTAPVDTVTGATSSTASFNELAEAVIAQALVGDTSRIVLPMNETYTAEDRPDERGGWIGTIALTFSDGRLASVNYDEVLRVGGQITDRKTTNSQYAARYAEVNGITPAEVYQELESELMSTGDPGMVDTITGATVASGRFRRLAAETLGKRISVDLP